MFKQEGFQLNQQDTLKQGTRPSCTIVASVKLYERVDIMQIFVVQNQINEG